MSSVESTASLCASSPKFDTAVKNGNTQVCSIARIDTDIDIPATVEDEAKRHSTFVQLVTTVCQQSSMITPQSRLFKGRSLVYYGKSLALSNESTSSIKQLPELNMTQLKQIAKTCDVGKLDVFLSTHASRLVFSAHMKPNPVLSDASVLKRKRTHDVDDCKEFSNTQTSEYSQAQKRLRVESCDADRKKESNTITATNVELARQLASNLQSFTDEQGKGVFDTIIVQEMEPKASTICANDSSSVLDSIDNHRFENTTIIARAKFGVSIHLQQLLDTCERYGIVDGYVTTNEFRQGKWSQIGSACWQLGSKNGLIAQTYYLTLS